MQNSKDCKIRALQIARFELFVIIHPYMDVTVAGEGVQCSAPTVFEQGGILSCHTCYDTGRRLHSLIRRTAPIGRILRQARGTEDLF